ncbi:hypothetical protein MRX96_003777 [Rhipicephalus microplus]
MAMLKPDGPRVAGDIITSRSAYPCCRWSAAKKPSSGSRASRGGHDVKDIMCGLRPAAPELLPRLLATYTYHNRLVVGRCSTKARLLAMSTVVAPRCGN